MPRNVNLYYGKPTKTGITRQVDQYTMTITANFTKDNGTAGTATRTVLFPDLLLAFSAEELIEIFQELGVKAIRKQEGI